MNNNDRYATYYPDVQISGLQPGEHFISIGRKLGRRWGQGMRGTLPDPACELPLWEDRSAPDSSTYQKTEFPKIDTASLLAEHRLYQIQRRKLAAKCAIVTAIAGEYDSPKYHEKLSPVADYFIYSNVVKHSPLFSIQNMPLFDSDPTRMARFVKTHLADLLPEYDVVVWVDANVLIRGDIDEEIATFDASGMAFAAIEHPLRTNIYDEGSACIKRSKDDAGIIAEQLERYHSEGYKSEWLVESNFMMFRPNHPLTRKFTRAWWGELERGSRRDQLSLPYVADKMGVDWFRLSERPNSVRNHPKLALLRHGLKPEYHDINEHHCHNYSAARNNTEISPKYDLNPTVDVIVCVHNALDYVKNCIESVALNRCEDLHRIIIVNDGSGRDTTSWLEEFAKTAKNVVLVQHEIARGYTKAANVGLRLSSADFVILLNSDTLVSDRWIDKISRTFIRFPNIGIVGPMSNAASHQSIPEHKDGNAQTAINPLPPGFDAGRMDRWCEDRTGGREYTLVPLVHGFCMAISRSVIDTIGYFDEETFPQGYGEENDFCLRASNAGFILAVALNVFVYHEKSMSYDDEVRVMLMKDSGQALRKKHGLARVKRCVSSMQNNPELWRLRHLSKGLFK